MHERVYGLKIPFDKHHKYSTNQTSNLEKQIIINLRYHHIKGNDTINIGTLEEMQEFKGILPNIHNRPNLEQIIPLLQALYGITIDAKLVQSEFSNETLDSKSHLSWEQILSEINVMISNSFITDKFLRGGHTKYKWTRVNFVGYDRIFPLLNFYGKPRQIITDILSK